MSQPLEQITKAKKSSQDDSECSSESDTKSEEGSTTSEEDMFLSIQYPSLPNFPTSYLCNQDFESSKEALKFITKCFNLDTIHESVTDFPNLSKNIIYFNTYMDPD